MPAARILLDAHQTGRDDLRIIYHQAVARIQIFDNVTEHPVLHSARLPVQDQQAGAASVLQRILRDQLLGKVIIKITRLHLFRFLFQFCQYFFFLK